MLTPTTSSIFRRRPRSTEIVSRSSDPAYVAQASYIDVKTMQGLGLKFVDDFKGRVQEGVGFMQITVGDRQRCGAVKLRETG